MGGCVKSDLELVLAAHSKDSALVEQVMNAGELAQQDIRLLLTLIADGKLRSNPVCTIQHWYIPPVCTRPHYPGLAPYWPQPVWGSTTNPQPNQSIYTLTAGANG